MHTEGISRRGNGFIISGGASLPPKNAKNIKKFAPDSILQPVKASAEAFGSAAAEAFEEYAKCASEINKHFFVKALSCAVAIVSLIIFFKYFTFAEAIYYDKKCIAVVSSVKAYKKISNQTKKMAFGLGTKDFSADYKAFPIIVQRKKVNKEKEAVSNLLLSSPDFSRAYTLISDGKAVYNAKSMSDAKKVIDEYINMYALDGKAETAQNISIEKRIIAAKDIQSNAQCRALLKETGLVTVVSISDTSFDKSIPFDTRTDADNSLYLGEKVTISEGSEGVARVSQKTVYKNGIEESVSVLSESVTAEPVARVIKVGTKEKEVLKTGLMWPAHGTISSPFGSRWGRQHEGIDIAVPVGTPVKAAECGTVEYVSENAGGYGKFIRINHGYGVKTAYGHLSKIEVKEGQTVTHEDEIALSGNTGNSTGPHLHFEIINSGEKIDPLPHLKD